MLKITHINIRKNSRSSLRIFVLIALMWRVWKSLHRRWDNVLRRMFWEDGASFHELSLRRYRCRCASVNWRHTDELEAFGGLGQGFSNYGSRSHRDRLRSRNVILGSRNKLAWQIRYNNFCELCKKNKNRPAVNLFLLHF